GHNPLQGRAGADIALGDIQVVAVHVEVVFSIGRGRVDQLEKGLAGRLRGILQNCQRFIQRLVADQIHHDPDLPRADAGATENSPCFHCLLLLSYLPVVLPPAWPVNLRVGANSPSLWPTMSSVT